MLKIVSWTHITEKICDKTKFIACFESIITYFSKYKRWIFRRSRPRNGYTTVLNPQSPSKSDSTSFDFYKVHYATNELKPHWKHLFSYPRKLIKYQWNDRKHNSRWLYKSGSTIAEIPRARTYKGPISRFYEKCSTEAHPVKMFPRY